MTYVELRSINKRCVSSATTRLRTPDKNGPFSWHQSIGYLIFFFTNLYLCQCFRFSVFLPILWNTEKYISHCPIHVLLSSHSLIIVSVSLRTRKMGNNTLAAKFRRKEQNFCISKTLSTPHTLHYMYIYYTYFISNTCSHHANALTLAYMPCQSPVVLEVILQLDIHNL
jgi:hypothetical protein